MPQKPKPYFKNKAPNKPPKIYPKKIEAGNFQYQRRNQNKVSINNQIRALEMRVINHDGNNLGIISKDEALKIAKEAGLDLIEVSNTTNPPICKITDYGKWSYEQQKRLKEVKAKQIISETKNIQIGIGTEGNDLFIKSKQAAEWIKSGHRVKIELRLKGREKYMDEKFLKDRLNKILSIIPAEYKIADLIKRIPKGFALTLEKVK